MAFMCAETDLEKAAFIISTKILTSRMRIFHISSKVLFVGSENKVAVIIYFEFEPTKLLNILLERPEKPKSFYYTTTIISNHSLNFLDRLLKQNNN